MNRCASLAAAVVAGSLAAAGCGGGGHLTGSGGAGQIQTGSGGIGLFGGGTGTGGTPGPNCGAVSRPTQPLPPDILIVLDTSASMNDGFAGPCPGACDAGSKWASAVSAIDSVVSAQKPAVNWGLKLMADGADACDAGGIAVPVGSFAGVDVEVALTRRTDAGLLTAPGNRPMRAAIEVAAAHLSGRDPGPLHTILLITDGVPDCNPGQADPLASDAAATLQVITDATAAGISTYVVGLGTLSAAADAALEQLAQAGGLAGAGTPAYAPASGSADLVTAMNALLAQTAACTFAVPEPPTTDGTTSRGEIAVLMRGLDMVDRYVGQDPMNGWVYTDASMLGIQLLGSACEAVRAGSTVSISFLCYD